MSAKVVSLFESWLAIYISANGVHILDFGRPPILARDQLTFQNEVVRLIDGPIEVLSDDQIQHDGLLFEFIYWNDLALCFNADAKRDGLPVLYPPLNVCGPIVISGFDRKNARLDSLTDFVADRLYSLIASRTSQDSTP